MSIAKTLFGQTPDGQPIYLYTLTNSHGISASFTDLGGTWVSMMVPDRDGQMADVVLGYDTVEKYMVKGPHFGAIVGRNANRIAGGCFTLNGKEYRLELNNGPNNLHSGPDYYEFRMWDAQVSEEELKISFALQSPDGDQGYPGNGDIIVTYTLTEDDAVEINYRMICDADTVVNFTNHSYFNLAGHDSGYIGAQKAWINADFFTPSDEFSIPTGELRPVDGTPMDFREMKALGEEIDNGYEQLAMAGGYAHNWVINGYGTGIVLAAKAVDEASGRTLEVYTDLPGVQLYTANGLDGAVSGKGGAKHGPRTAFCFETQFYPNAVNTPSFPSPVLKAGEEYNHTTIYKFGAEKR